MQSDLTGLAPFIYFGRTLRVEEPKQLFSIGMQHCYALWAQRDGLTWLERAGSKWRLMPEQVFLAEPGTAARWTAPAHVSFIIFDLVPRTRRRNRNGVAYPRRWTTQPEWRELFDCELRPELQHSWAARARSLVSLGCLYNRERDVLGCLTVNLRLGNWIVDYASFMAKPPPPKEHANLNLFQTASQLLMRDFSPRMKVEEAARMLGVSREHLTRIFQRTRGIGPGRYRLEEQVHQAQELLLHSEFTLEEIARRTGFSGTSSFRRSFGQIVGATPSFWRAEQRRLVNARNEPQVSTDGAVPASRPVRH